MPYRAYFFKLDPISDKWFDEGWTEEDFRWAVEQVETMPKETLVKILEEPDIEISFGGAYWRTETPREQMMSALFADATPQQIIQAIKKHTRQANG